MAPAWRLKKLYASGERWLRLQQGNLAMLVTSLTSLRLRIEKNTHHASGKKYWFTAPDSNRLHSVSWTDALPNELACNFHPIAWCKLKRLVSRICGLIPALEVGPACDT